MPENDGEPTRSAAFDELVAEAEDDVFDPDPEVGVPDPDPPVATFLAVMFHLSKNSINTFVALRSDADFVGHLCPSSGR